ncbi:SusD/RagB family nutrient-binding outer membrane lipoprotein [Runella sp. MFBS21]|uniref:SusD/RagB family nutrient-binding outer membrane lipoprotein n=1 Tax=Runella sp. MFBS21 TaxID=3034018 RepID=UPI0023F76D90|nr:SusD/RagB family nutrient-binding outer membrane lipoprotein [Runella sp. MFBS21]MDF7819825.1 SusD/RagB family nutrient-binding outer membrane lipoprotein [Runella sp. MFBS21]
MLKLISKSLLVLAVMVIASCSDKLSEINENPNGIDPATANPNLMMPEIMNSVGRAYLELGYGDVAGVAQHIQHDGWFSGVNHYDWGPQDWNGWYNILRNNEFLYKRSVTLNYKFHQGVALTMRSFIFGVITDLWGDAPYTSAVKGDQSNEFLKPAFDSQEVIYKGIIADLKTASELFASKDATGYTAGYDIYYNGNPTSWQKFANTLLLRYYMRVSEKMSAEAKAGIEAVYASGVYIKTPSEDATMSYIGATSGNSWPGATAFDQEQSNFRRKKPAQTLVNALLTNKDPRLKVWIAPVHVQWVADPTLATAVDPFIRKDGVVMTGTPYLTDQVLNVEVKKGIKFTRRYNPNLYTGTLDTNEYVGVPPGLRQPDYYNNNPTPGQTVQNQHVSQLADVYRGSSGGLLRARLASSAETAFILAEAAQKGWSVGSAATHYNAGVKNSLETWGVGTQYDAYIAQPGVAFNNTLARIMEQKWIASWTAATEAWFDYRRTGLPALKAGPASAEPVLPVRFNYGDNEVNFNRTNADAAINKLETTTHSGLRGKNSQWSKPWIVQGTSKPW